MDANMFEPDGTRKAPADADKIRLGQRIEAAEARTGEPSPARLLAERAVEAIRASSSLTDMRDRADRVNCTIVIEDTIVDGKIRHQGFVKSGDGSGLRVKLSALPADCRAGAIMRRFDAEDVPTINKAMTANQAKFHARAAFKAAEAAAPATFDAFLADAGKRLGEKGMSIEKYGKTGGYLRFAEGDEGRMKLSALGGKYSLHALSKKYDGKITTNASFVHGNQEKVNGLSAKSLASSAVSRATSADARAAAIAGETVQAQTLAEALSDADAQAVALDAARRAHAAAARAEARAEQAEAALRQLETETHQKKENAMDLKPTTTPEKSTEKDSTTIEAEAQEKENPTSDTHQTEAASKAVTQEKVNKEKEFDISLDLCADPAVPGIAADAAQDNAQTPRLR